MKTMLMTIALAALLGGPAHADNCASHSQAKNESATKTSATSGMKNILETATDAGTFSTLLTAAKAAGLVEALQGKGPLTVFAPTDEAFAELPEGTIESLLKDTKKLAAVLTYHIVEGAVTSAQVAALDKAQTLNGQNVRVTSKEGKVRIDDATVIAADVVCSNGVIHVIDKVILPAM